MLRGGGVVFVAARRFTSVGCYDIDSRLLLSCGLAAGYRPASNLDRNAM